MGYSRRTLNYPEKITLSNINYMMSMADPIVTRRDREVIDFTWSRVKNNSELTNLMKMYRIEGYNGKEGSNPQGNKEFLDVFIKIDQIGQ